MSGVIKKPEEFKQRLGEVLISLFQKAQQNQNIEDQALNTKPYIYLVVGVNGGGKTTSLGKLAHKFTSQDLKVQFVAADTFRAASYQQLKVWSDATGSSIFPDEGYNQQVTQKQKSIKKRLDEKLSERQPKKKKKQSLAAEVVKNGITQVYIQEPEDQPDVVLCDTSGRLHTDWRLMDELKECKTQISYIYPDAPHEVLLVLDGTSGINMLNQAKEFKEAVNVSGIVLTKLDGTSKGGAVVSVVDQLQIPVKFVGVGEKLNDLQTFNEYEFVKAIFPGFLQKEEAVV